MLDVGTGDQNCLRLYPHLPPGAPGRVGEKERGRDDSKYGRKSCDRKARAANLQNALGSFSILAQLYFLLLSDQTVVFCTHLLFTPPCLCTCNFLYLCFPSVFWQSLSPPHITWPGNIPSSIPTPYQVHLVLLCAVCRRHYRDCIAALFTLFCE